MNGRITKVMNPTATAAPRSVWMMPSTMNGTRMNQFVAPTSFITSISRRRANIATRIVLRMSRAAATSRSTGGERGSRTPILLNVSWIALDDLEGEHDLVHARLGLGTVWPRALTTSGSLVTGATRNDGGQDLGRHASRPAAG